MLIHKKPEGVISLKVLTWKQPTVTSAHIALINASHRAEPNINGMEKWLPIAMESPEANNTHVEFNMWRG